MRNKNRKSEIVPDPMAENEYESYRENFFSRYRKSPADASPEMDRRCARSYLRWLKNSGNIVLVDWRNPPTFKELMEAENKKSK